MRIILTSAMAIVLTLVLTVRGATAYTVPLPNSMASTGDSITRAFDINFFHVLQDSPQYSWSTGYSNAVNSQYRRVLALNPAIKNKEHNDAMTGAVMANLDGQVIAAAGQGVQYLTILMGANDLCTTSVNNMTPTATFQAEFQQALSDFFAHDSTAHVSVSSLPDVFHLWSIFHNNPSAELAWQTFSICQSMLSTSDTPADRQMVVDQESQDNTVLQTVCGQFANCLWDNYAGYNFKFPVADISTVDYFHPDIQGQNDIARVTWGASYWHK